MACLPCKEEEDNGMGIEAARLYAAVVAHMFSKDNKRITRTLRVIDMEAPVFYANVTEKVTRKVAQRLLALELTDDQRERLMKQINEQCYRAEDFIRWSRSSDGVFPERVSEWTERIFLWLKEDQDFYIALSAEVE